MRWRAPLLPCLLAFTGCTASTAPLQMPMDVVGVVSKPIYSGWQIDNCGGGQAVNPSTACLRPDGDIYKVILLDVRTRDGMPVARKVAAGYPGRALPRDYRATRLLRLVKSSDSLREDTGIEYVAIDLSAATLDP